MVRPIGSWELEVGSFSERPSALDERDRIVVLRDRQALDWFEEGPDALPGTGPRTAVELLRQPSSSSVFGPTTPYLTGFLRRKLVLSRDFLEAED